jgi:hypothetical protein
MPTANLEDESLMVKAVFCGFENELSTHQFQMGEVVF